MTLPSERVVMKIRLTGARAMRWAGGMLAVAMTALALGVAAQPSKRVHKPAPPPRWHGDIARFHQHDWPVWRAGRWAHTRHDGRLGWWWVVGSSWYYYPAPVYPVPDPWVPPPVTIVAPPVTDYWYYCDAAQAYYPYVATCPAGWKQVPAKPVDAPPAPPQ